MNDFLHWLLVASLQACVILPWVLGLTVLSQRAPAAWLVTLLGVGMLLPLAAPWLALPGKTLVIPALERSGLYEAGPQAQSPAHLKEPLPPGAGEAARALALENGWRIAFSLWAAGAAITTVGRFWHALRERLRLGQGEPLTGEDELLEEWARIAAAVGLNRTPWLVNCTAIHSAQVIGVIQPVLALPAGFSDRAAAERAMILTHEAEHLVRHDPQRRLVLEAVRAIFWFHPLFTWLLWHHDLQTEKACDDAVLKAGHTPRDYAELLLAEARRQRRGGKMLRARVRSLLSPHRVRSRTVSPALKTGYAILFALLLLPSFAARIRPWEDESEFRPLTAGEPVAAWWRCRTGHGSTVLDWSGHGLHGRVLGTNWVEDPERGDCLEFDGHGDMIALPAVDCDWSLGPLTFAMWLKPQEGSDGGGLLLRGEPNRAWSGAKETRFDTGYTDYGERTIVLAGDIKVDHTGQLAPGLRPGLDLYGIISFSGPDPLPAARWTHLALTVHGEGDQIVQRWYLNAVLAGEQRFHPKLQTNQDWPTSWWWFGRGESPQVQGNDYEGRLSDLVILRKALTKQELHDLMSGKMPRD